MGRVNVNYNEKQTVSDIFTLTNVVSGESVALIPSDSAGNFAWSGITKAPIIRNAMQTSQTSGEWSDLEYPFMAIPQEDWTGGRANLRFTTDKSRFFDSRRAQTAFNACIYNAPLDYYSEGFRANVYTNYPGNVHWKPLLSGELSIQVTEEASLLAGECRILLRRVGTPAEALTVGLGTDEENVVEEEITTADITDTVSEFHRVTFTGETITGNYLNISATDGTLKDHWEIGVKRIDDDTEEPYYRLSPIQEGYRSIFFQYEQLLFMVRQKPNGTPSLWMNGDIGTLQSLDGTFSKNVAAIQYTPEDKQEDGYLYTGQYKDVGGNDWIDIPDGYYIDMTPDDDVYLMYQKNQRENYNIVDSRKSWTANQWQGARIGLVYGHGVDGQVSVWRTITGNTATTISIDKPWDTLPDTDTTYIIVDTPIWTEVLGNNLSVAVTDVEVIHGVVYICQGDYTPYSVMWYDFKSGTFEFGNDTYATQIIDTTGDEDVDDIIKTESLCATYIKAVRDSDGIMLWRARNDAVTYEVYNVAEEDEDPDWRVAMSHEHNRVIDKSYLIDRNILVGEVGLLPIHYKWQSQSALSPSSGKTIIDCTSFPSIDGERINGGEYADFYGPDIDFKQYQIKIGKFTQEKNTGLLTITLQESPDIYNWQDVKSITATCEGVFYLHAHCQHRYRRIMATVAGTSASVRKIEITMGTSPVFTDAIVLKDNYGKITNLYEYGAEQEKNLWVFQEGMVSSVNKSSTNTYTLDKINLDELYSTADEWNASAVNKNDVYLLWSWLNGLQRYYNTQLEGKGPDHDEGMPMDMRGRITGFASYPGSFFATIAADDGYSSVMMFNGSGWHNLYRAPNTGEQIYAIEYQPIYGNRPDRLWVQVGDDVIWLAMPSKILYALQDPCAEYTHESVVVSAWITGGMAEVDKLWQSLSIMADYLDGTTCWIEADYQLDNEEAWHPMKSIYTRSPQEEFNFAGADESVNGKKLRYRLRLYTTDIHKTPKVNVVLIKAVGRVDIKYSYAFHFRNIKYKPDLTGEYEDVEPYELDLILCNWANKLCTLRLNSAYRIFDNILGFIDGPQTSVVYEKSEGYLSQITLTEI